MIVAVLTVRLFVWPAAAAQFQSDYLKFELPTGWTCELEQTDFVCNPSHADGEAVGAIMILTAKFAGPNDTLSDFKRHLDQRAEELGPQAILRAPAFVVIENTLWVDATLIGSEMASYDSRYLATTRDQIAILFTFSAHHSVYDQLLGAAVEAVHTLQMVDDWKRQMPTDKALPAR
ncbi:hypothetical protein BRAS3843_940013 [Bradyrhizobium sp. STM 3843]|uniref:hypothetical protein n=1 Tax=Bradyrhizobium sp. STM 3843 TaxID=551947 RepID=UPI00024038B0|nr:hypothetical protein [Bradyrhizobium sp. STM 3843]CCE12109.1 hypothetical protein BRAS3843_940013 [Bradyrhizobium sp. STM 3843]